MVMKRNFGIVSVKRLSKLALLVACLSGCSGNIISSEDAAENWERQLDYCIESAKSNKVDFPNTPWFDSLSFEDKKSVIGYIYNYNERICMNDVSEALRLSLKHDNNTVLMDRYSTDLSPLDEISAERMKGLDKSEILKIQKAFSAPFSIRHVLTEENLYPHQ